MALLVVFLRDALMCVLKGRVDWSRLSAYFGAVVYGAACGACLLNAALTGAVSLYNASFFCQ